MSKTYIPTNLRQIVFERAQGCCEYCLIPEMLVLATHQIDHVIAEEKPKSLSRLVPSLKTGNVFQEAEPLVKPLEAEPKRMVSQPGG